MMRNGTSDQEARARIYQALFDITKQTEEVRQLKTVEVEPKLEQVRRLMGVEDNINPKHLTAGDGRFWLSAVAAAAALLATGVAAGSAITAYLFYLGDH
jgi:hypothetical protein